MNWSKIAGIILRYRIMILLVITGLTCFMALLVPKLDLDYGYSGMMPDSDSVAIKLEEFKEVFGGDANIILLGVQDDEFFSKGKFNDWIDLKNDLLEIEGIESVISVSDVINLNKNSAGGKFEIAPIFPGKIVSQVELDSLVRVLKNLPIYRDLLYTPDTGVYMMMLTMNSALVDSRKEK